MRNSSSHARAVVVATFATQMVVTMSNSTLPTIAPKLAEALGIQPARLSGEAAVRRYTPPERRNFLFSIKPSGVLLGPSVFAMLYTTIGSYSATFLLMAIAAAAGGVLVLVARRGVRLAQRAA
jgi:hypothetical protein